MLAKEPMVPFTKEPMVPSSSLYEGTHGSLELPPFL